MLRTLFVTLALATAGAASAQTTDNGAQTMAATDTAPSTAAFSAAMNTMMANMMIPYSGNPDVDFVRGMIPHHQGAVDNARIVLQFGTDPEVRKFAEEVLATQEAEIKWMTDWLAANAP